MTKFSVTNDSKLFMNLPDNTSMFVLEPEDLLKQWAELAEGGKLDLSVKKAANVIAPDKKAAKIRKTLMFFSEQILQFDLSSGSSIARNEFDYLTAAQRSNCYRYIGGLFPEEWTEKFINNKFSEYKLDRENSSEEEGFDAEIGKPNAPVSYYKGTSNYY